MTFLFVLSMQGRALYSGNVRSSLLLISIITVEKMTTDTVLDVFIIHIFISPINYYSRLL